MFSNYLRIAFRNLAKNRLFSALNIIGLSIGLATGLLILIWVQDELSFDKQHADIDRIFRENAHFKSGDEVQSWENTPSPHAAYALREIPEVEKAVRICAAGAPLIRYNGFADIEEKGVFADTSFFEVFKTEMLAGNTRKPFTDLNSIVLTQTFAEKYFGTTKDFSSLLGKSLQIDQKEATVSAILRDFPENCSFQYDYLRPFEYLKARFKGNDMWKSKEEDWGDFNDATYLKLRPGANAAAVATKLGVLQHQHNPYDPGSYYSLQPMAESHLIAADGADAGAQTVRIMSIAALFILLIACINYINMATAKATQRALEVGLRKAIGAKRSQLIGQFMAESALVFLLSSSLALLFSYLLLPYCNDISGKKLHLDWSNPSLQLMLGAVLGGAMLLSAIYPAFVLSGFNPIRVMKGQLASGRDAQARLRKTLVVTQFVFSVSLLFAMLVIGRQMDYIRTKNLGYDRENVFEISLSEATYKNREAILRELQNSPGVRAVSAASGDIMLTGSTTGDTKWDGQTADQHLIVSPMAIAPDFMSFFKLKLKSGSGFTGSEADSTSFIINETAAAQMGISDPIGKRFTLWQTTGTIIGVVQDFHFATLRETIKPAIFFSNPEWHGTIYVKTTGAEASKAVASAEALWKRFDSAYPFDYSFMDEAFDKMYRSEQRTASLFKSFSLIALLISCLGLFGLSAFTVEKRHREIGIRKVLGASVSNITGLLARDFMGLVFIAIVIASPLAYYFMNKWLADYPYRIELSGWMLLAAGALASVVAVVTVGFQSLKAAWADPVQTLRSE